MAAVWIELLVTIIKTFFIGAFIIWILFLLIWAFFKVCNKQRRLWIKFKLFKKNYNEDDVAWAMKAVDADWKEFNIRKYLLLNGVKPKKIEEIVFIFREISKELKGGVIESGRSKESNAENKLPKI